MSLTSVDLPEPLTPVMATKQPSGKLASTFFRLFSVAPLTDRIRDLSTGRRAAGTAMDLRPDR